MKRLLLIFVLVAPLALAQQSLVGTWKTDFDTYQGPNDKFSLNNGVYECNSCSAKIHVKADGKDHPVTGSDYYNTVSVRVLDDNNLEITIKKDGKLFQTEKNTISDDGNKLTIAFAITYENGKSANGTFTETRVGSAPAGGHKISGEWKNDKMVNASDNIGLVTYKLEGDTLVMDDHQGSSYRAKLDGKDYPFQGDPSITHVSVKKIDDNTIAETFKKNGKVVYMSRTAVAPDGKTIAATWEDKVRGRDAKWTAKKQDTSAATQ